MLLFHDGFDHYGSSTLPSTITTNGNFTTAGYELPADSNGAFVAGKVSMSGFSTAYGIRLTPRAAASTWVKRAIPQDWQNLLGFGVSINFPNVALPAPVKIIELTGEIVVSVGTDFKVSLGGISTGYELERTVWYVFEVVIHKEAAIAELWISNKKVATLPLSDLAPTHWHVMQQNLSGTSVASQGLTMDDVYLLDGSGDVNNARLGRTNTLTRSPNVDAQKEFGRMSSNVNNYAYVNDQFANGESNYVVGADVGMTDLYWNATVPTVTEKVHAVSVIISARKEEPDETTVAPVLKSGDAMSVGAGMNIRCSYYIEEKATFETDPATGMPWNNAAAFEARWGQRIVEA